jgi:3-hydroxyisobutyrate dehydrogenase-like beta-hydroxyacid dehydrogenase
LYKILIMKGINQEVTIIGLGAMGGKLADVLLEAGYDVTVWNRDSSKAMALAAKGAKAAATPVEAIEASPVIIMCVKDYNVSHSILGTDDARRALNGRLLIELSTGTPKNAREGRQLADDAGADYLDGALLATPPQIGRPDTPIFVSGENKAFQKAEQVMRTLGGGLQYMGSKDGDASAWDLAFLSCLFGGMLGFYHGAALLESENINVEDYGNMMSSLAPVTGEMIKYEGKVIGNNLFTDVQSSLITSSVTFKLLLEHANESGISKEWPQFGMNLLQKAIDAGYGHEQVAAVIKVLR